MDHLRLNSANFKKWTPAIQCNARLRGVASLIYALFAMILMGTPLYAQSADCDRIRAQIAYIDQSSPLARPNQYSEAAQKQQAEIEKTAAYAHSLGCDRRGFAFFGNQAPPQCGGLNARIQSMQANLGQLQSMAARSGGGAPVQRQDLVARYNAYCRNQPRSFFDQLFGRGDNQQADIPDEPLPPPDDQTPKGGSQAICVRTCDGGFFPLNYSARREGLEDLCQSLCPNAQVSLFTRNPDNDVGTAVGADGTPYRDLENAFKFQKTFDPTCTCKAKGETWAQALTESDAERMLGQEHKGDIIVTPEQSLEMSRPKVGPPVRAKGPATESVPAPAVKPANASAQSSTPPASGNTPPIAAKMTAESADQAGTPEIIGADGVKRRVWIVGPTP